MFKKFFLVVIAALFFSSIYAAECKPYAIQNQNTSDWESFTSPGAACAWAIPQADETYSYSVKTVAPGSCTYLRSDANEIVVPITITPCACDPGPAGNRTWFAGWNTVSGGDLDTEVPGSDSGGRYTFCEGGCELVSDDVIDCWTQTEAADNGYFRQTCELSYSKTGTPCTESNSPPGPNDAPPLPPGTPDPNPGGDDPTGPDSDNDTDGGDGGPTGGEPTKDPDACSASQIANGTCPGSGSGPVGGGGSFPPVPDDPATCGGEGQPLCRVQVNESGTTDGSGHLETMKGHGDKLTELSKEDGTFWTKVKTYLHKTANELAGWTWSFSLPTGCTPMHLDGFDMTIDVCQFQGTIHDLMSFLWVLCTVYGLVRLFIWGIA